jgi:hypothetical protein
MFSLDAKVNVTILSISVYSLSTATGIAAEVWTRSGNYTGYELNSTAWTKVGGKSKMYYLLDGIYCTHTLPHTHTE